MDRFQLGTILVSSALQVDGTRVNGNVLTSNVLRLKGCALNYEFSWGRGHSDKGSESEREVLWFAYGSPSSKGTVLADDVIHYWTGLTPTEIKGVHPLAPA